MHIFVIVLVFISCLTGMLAHLAMGVPVIPAFRARAGYVTTVFAVITIPAMAKSVYTVTMKATVVDAVVEAEPPKLIVDFGRPGDIFLGVLLFGMSHPTVEPKFVVTLDVYHSMAVPSGGLLVSKPLGCTGFDIIAAAIPIRALASGNCDENGIGRATGPSIQHFSASRFQKDAGAVFVDSHVAIVLLAILHGLRVLQWARRSVRKHGSAVLSLIEVFILFGDCREVDRGGCGAFVRAPIVACVGGTDESSGVGESGCWD